MKTNAIQSAGFSKKSDVPKMKVKRVTEYIKSNPTRNFTLDELAEYADLSKSYFCHIFKRVTGTSVSQYVAKCRLELAMHLLKTGKCKTYLEAACEAGFGCYSSFYRVYRKKYGKPPNAD